MEPKPVEQSRQPGYPTRREVLAGAASLALANLAGQDIVFAGSSEEGGTIVAPIFQHGEGRGATGCVVVSPPVFLSEEEAAQILREELVKHGIRLKAGGTLEDVRVPPVIREPKAIKRPDGGTRITWSVVEAADRAKPLVLSGMDSDKKIAVAFVSRDDYFNLGGAPDLSTVQPYQFKDVAENVAARAKKEGKGRVYLGVFYDPCPRTRPARVPAEGDETARVAAWQKARQEAREKGKQESAKLLRQQAQDFADWLKKQKAI
jgi:hypothetical protein